MPRKKRSIIIALCILCAIVVMLALIFAIVINLPLSSLGLSDKVVVNGKTVADMRLDDVSIAKLYPLAKSLCKDNSRLVKDFPSGSDLSHIDGVFAQSSINSSNELKYSKLIYTSANFNAPRLLPFTDKQLAAILNRTVEQAPYDELLKTSADILEFLGNNALKDILSFLQDYDVTVEQLVLSNAHLQILLSLDISDYVGDVTLPVLGKMHGKVYAALDYSFTVNLLGSVVLSDGTLSVNGSNAAISGKVLDGLFVAINSGNGDPMTTQSLIDGIASYIKVVFDHIGDIGNGVKLGASGIDVANRTIYFVANTSIFDSLWD